MRRHRHLDDRPLDHGRRGLVVPAARHGKESEQDNDSGHASHGAGSGDGSIRTTAMTSTLHGAACRRSLCPGALTVLRSTAQNSRGKAVSRSTATACPPPSRGTTLSQRSVPTRPNRARHLSWLGGWVGPCVEGASVEENEGVADRRGLCDVGRLGGIGPPFDGSAALPGVSAVL